MTGFRTQQAEIDDAPSPPLRTRAAHVLHFRMDLITTAAATVLPVEFCITGLPVSQQAHDRERLREWKQRVRDRALSAVGPEATPYAGPVRITIQHFYEGEWPALDGDNMLKPIQDALAGLVYADDRQVISHECDRHQIDGAFRMLGVPPVLALRLIKGQEFVYIKVDHPRDPQEIRR